MTFDVPSNTKDPPYWEGQSRAIDTAFAGSLICSAEARAESPGSFESSLFGTTEELLILHMDLKMCIAYTYICNTGNIYQPKVLINMRIRECYKRHLQKKEPLFQSLKKQHM